MVRDGVLQAPFRNITMESNLVTVYGTRANLFQKLHRFPQVRTIWLEYDMKSFGPTQRKSTDVRFNELINSYYPLTAKDPLCTWIETPGMTFHKYDRQYNRTCNRNISINPQPSNLSLLFLNDQKLEEKEFPGQIFSPPEFVTYTQIIKNGLVSDIGEIFSENLTFVPIGCITKVNKVPKTTDPFPLFDEIFVISQLWGIEVFHMMVEDIPRLTIIHLEFLKNNEHIRIAGPADKAKRLGEILRILGLNEDRLHSGWCRAKVVYVPRGTTCNGASVPEIQLLSVHYRTYIERKFPHQQRNRIVLIRRSSWRKFTKQEAIEQVVQSAARDFNLTYSLFIDNPVPSLNDTMRLFRSAVMVVGPHGAGLSNMVFSEPGTVVIEGVCDRRHVNLCFQREAYVLGHHWYGIPSHGSCSGVSGVVDVAASEIKVAVRTYLYQKGFRENRSA